MRNKLKVIIGIDPDGVIWANEIRNTYFKNIPIDYLSFEIFFNDESVDKTKEIEACKHIRYLIIQDPLRNKLIRKENYIKNSVKTIYIPVSTIKSEKIINVPKHFFFREKYKLGADTKLIINFGTIDNWSGANFILDMLNKNILPKNYVFVIHSRYSLNKEYPIHFELLKYAENNSNLIISNDYLESFDEALNFLKQFNFGFSFYISEKNKYTGKNIYNIGLSSGKFSMYMKAGLPTFTNNLPTYRFLKKIYNFGFIISNISDFEILNNLKDDEYNNYKSNCKNLYNNILEPTKNIQTYFELIAKGSTR